MTLRCVTTAAAVISLLLTISVSSSDGRTYSDECLLPLAASIDDLCPQIEKLSYCYVRTFVSVDDRRSVSDSLQSIHTILQRLELEQCNLNDEFNNECHDGFTSCLDSVTTVSNDGKVEIVCSDEAYSSFQECVDIRLPDSIGFCYYSRWLELIVNSSRALECTTPETEAPPTKAPPTKAPPTEGEQPSDVYCDDGYGSRYYALSNCEKFQIKSLDTGYLFPVQPVAAGTLFDVSICAPNHRTAVTCPLKN